MPESNVGQNEHKVRKGNRARWEWCWFRKDV